MGYIVGTLTEAVRDFCASLSAVCRLRPCNSGVCGQKNSTVFPQLSSAGLTSDFFLEASMGELWVPGWLLLGLFLRLSHRAGTFPQQNVNF